MRAGFDKKRRLGARIVSQLSSIVEVVNPLAIVDSNRRLQIFENTAKCYEAAIMKLYSYYPRGYVDIVHFIVKAQGLSVSKATDVVGRRQYATIAWRNLSKTSENRLTVLVGYLLHETCCKFSENAFKQAVWSFKQYIAEVDDETDVIINVESHEIN